MASRKISDLTPSMQKKYHAFEAKMMALGLSFVVTCTARTIQEQMALYAQGRQPIDEVNELRRKCGLWEITDKENRRKVTWTLNSKHIVNWKDGNPNNDKSKAFDIVITKNKSAQWDLKVDVNNDDLPDYIQAGEIGESVGLRWGGHFGDSPHFEDK